ncbi:MAG: endopeptidase La [Acidimicrobiales bacterium]
MTSTKSQILPVLPLPNGVVLPDMVVTAALESEEARLAAESATEGNLLLVPRIEGRFARVGVVARIENTGKLPDGTAAITLRAERRVRVGSGVVGSTNALWVEAETVEDRPITDTDRALAISYKAAATALLERIGGARMAAAIDGIDSPGALADSIGYWPELNLDQRLELLETIDVGERLKKALNWVEEALAEVKVRQEINQRVTGELDDAQRKAVLRRQLQAIRAELGEDGEDGDQLGERLAELELPTNVREAVDKELARLERIGDESMEASWIRTWLEVVADIPWSETDDERIDLAEARRILDADHTGLEQVKERLVEHLAVRKLRSERGVSTEGRKHGVILTLVGPPGVGKTSLGESVASALGRKFVRMALGGIRDEAEIRGHRRTYVGARPGRLVRALTEAGSMNPVILLDEVDKVGGDWRGDPSAALLEVLDPAQNHSFRDHYLEFELDLSDVVFIATANVLDTIPGPLLDRMEIIALDGYSEHEKAAIAKTHLLPRILQRNALREDELVLEDGVVGRVAADWTREAGVRRLERLLDKLVRKAVTRLAAGESAPIRIGEGDLREILGNAVPRDETANRIDRPGIATGLAVTGAGGDVLLVETAIVDGDGEPLLTGQLGDVMKESAAIARSVASSAGESFGASARDGRLHIHFPAGATPKDGPSAGITMTTALVSLMSGRKVRSDVAMTGEVSLGGRVLPIGGVKQKLLAAHRSGIGTVVLPEGNRGDVDDVPSEVAEQLDIRFVSRIEDVLEVALTPAT